MAAQSGLFQGAPVLKDEFNPVEFVQGLKDKQFAVQKALYEQKEAGNKEYLSNLVTNLKGWEDQKGFQELQERNNTAYKVAMEAMKKGMNLSNPKNDAEVTLFKYLNDYHAQTKNLADQWEVQKGVYDKIQQLHEQEDALPPSERKVNWDETQKKLAEALEGHSIEDRKNLLQNAIVYNPIPADYNKIIEQNKDRITPPPRKQVETINPKTGDKEYTMTSGEVTPDIVEKNKKEFRNIYRTMTPAQKEGIKVIRQSDPDDQPDTDGIKMTDDEYLYSLYNPKYKQEYIQKPSSKGGISINVGGSNLKLNAPGQKSDKPIVYGGKTYNEHYDFNPKSTINVNLQDMGITKGVIGDQERDVYNGNNTPCELINYLPNEKAFVFRAKSPALGSEIMDKETFIIPQDKLADKGIENVPIIGDDGKQTTLETIMGKETKTVKSGIKWQ